jgi:hypothetical protein
VALALIGGAFAIAGTRLTQPASEVHVVTGPPLRSETTDRQEAERPTAEGTPTSAPSPGTEPSSTVTATGRIPTAPPPTSTEDGGSERGDD